MKVDAKPVMAGSRIKWTLEQIEQSNPGRVRVDWLRFTLPMDAIVSREPSLLDVTVLELLDQPGRDLVRKSSTVDVSEYTTAHAVALAGARQFCAMLGKFEVGAVLRGMDFYSVRVELRFAGETVGYVMAGAKSVKQAGTVHFNLFGSALLTITPAQLAPVRDWISAARGHVTRIDLSLDIWTGYSVTDAVQAYREGGFDVRGKRPGQKNHGSWELQHSRTFEVGSRETGKCCRVYEKGDEQFGHEAGSEWVRVEVEFRDNHRVISLDSMTRPADFFAGAYPLCAELLERERIAAEAERIPTVPDLIDTTAEAAVVRVVRWIKRTAAPAIVAAFDMGGDILAEIIDSERHRVPRRLLGIAPDRLRETFEKVAALMAPASAPSFNGA
ncbi:MAG: replication initiation factor domain-containing protein [Roseateles sp.]|uniref:replication initiation factor domain-containing protein n=1 Tax=Roseateles sp. TaxID=1971397 RepID=UPI0039EB6D79